MAIKKRKLPLILVIWFPGVGQSVKCTQLNVHFIFSLLQTGPHLLKDSSDSLCN